MTERQKVALVVDDEVFARIYAMQILEDQGFQCLEAESTVEALDVLDRHREVSLLVTDVSMPGDTDGLALAWKVSSNYPKIRIIIVSGRVRPALTEMPARAKFLAKPYASHNLTASIRQSPTGAGSHA